MRGSYTGMETRTIYRNRGLKRNMDYAWLGWCNILSFYFRCFFNLSRKYPSTEVAFRFLDISSRNVTKKQIAELFLEFIHFSFSFYFHFWSLSSSSRVFILFFSSTILCVSLWICNRKHTLIPNP